MSEEIKYGFIPIKDIFSEKWYKIPEYQRPYVWGKEQATELLDDIMSEVTKLHNEQKLSREYFLGSLVWKITPRFDGTSNYEEFEVLDGQQRLTTMLLITAVIRDIVTDSECISTCEEMIFQKANRFKGIPERSRIVFGIREDVQKFADKFIKSKDGTKLTSELHEYADDEKSEINCRHMSEVLLTVHDYFRGFSQEQIADFFAFFCMQVKVIYISSVRLEDAFHLFNVMNNRGIKLRNSDILKAENLSQIEDESSRLSYAKQWEEIENYFGEDFDQFLEFVRLCIVKKKAAVSLLREFEDNIYQPTEYDRSEKKTKKLSPLLRKGKETFDCVKRYFDAYQVVFEDNKFPVLTNNILRIMDYGIEADFWKAALLHYYIKFKTEQFDEFLNMLNCKFTADWLNELYLTKRIENICKIIETIDHAESSNAVLQNECLNFDTTTVREILNGDVYGKKYCRYILLLINVLFRDPHEVQSFPDTVSIEHILPQTPRADSQWMEDFTEENRGICTNRLGNLMLISRKKNSSLSNHPYHIKKEKYFRDKIDSFALSKRIYGKYAAWTPQTFEENHQEVLSILMQYFGACYH